MAVGKGITIPLSLNPREWLSGIRVVERSLKDMDSDLDRVEDTGDAAARKLEGHFTDAAGDMQSAFDRFARSFDDEMRKVESTARDTGDTIERGAAGARSAGGVLAGEVFDEFIESWGEAVRSGDYGEAIRETFSNLGQIGGVFGPAGAAAGAIGGFFLTKLYDSIANPEQARRIGEATGLLLDGGYTAARDAGAKTWQQYRDAMLAASDKDALLLSATGADSLAGAFDVINDKASLLGDTLRQDIIVALRDQGTAGTNAWSNIEAEINASDQTLRELLENYNGLDPAQEAAISQERRRNAQLREADALISDQREGISEATSKAKQLGDAENRIARETRAAKQQAKERADRVGDAARNAGDLRQEMDRTKPPDLSGLVNQTRAARDLAKQTREWWDGLGPKSVALDITYRTRNAPKVAG